MFAIFKREFKSFFTSFIGYLFLIITFVANGLLFYLQNVSFGSPYYASTVSIVSFVFIVSVPILTMKTLTDERKNKIDQLTLTAPVSVGDIVWGKFLALEAVLLMAVAAIAVCPLVMGICGNAPYAENLLTVLGLFFLGSAAIAISLFFSSLTDNQVIAAVLGVAALLLGLFIFPNLAGWFSGMPEWLKTIVGLYDLQTHYYEMLNGVLELTGVVYFTSLCILFVFLTMQSIQKRRYTVSTEGAGRGAYNVFSIIIAICIAVIVNLIVEKVPASYTAVDVTDEKLFSLTEDGKEYLKGLESDVCLYVMSTEEAEDPMVVQTLNRMDAASDHVIIKYIDPTINPQFTKKYTEERVASQSIIVVSDLRSKVVDYANFYVQSMDNSGNYSTTGYDAEGMIISAIDFTLTQDIPKVYATKGHGETALEAAFQDAIRKLNVSYETVNLMDMDEIDANEVPTVLIYAPQNDFSKDDVDKLEKYIDNGGNVIVIPVPDSALPSNLAALLDYMGISELDGIVCDDSSCYGYAYNLILSIEASKFTKSVYSSYYTLVPNSVAFAIDDTRDDVTFTPFLTTTEEGYLIRQDGSESERNTYNIAVAANAGNGTLVVYGSAVMFTNSVNSYVGNANMSLLTDAVSAFTRFDSGISIPAKSYNVSALILKQEIKSLILFVLIASPCALFIAGISVIVIRRKK